LKNTFTCSWLGLSSVSSQLAQIINPWLETRGICLPLLGDVNFSHQATVNIFTVYLLLVTLEPINNLRDTLPPHLSFFFPVLGIEPRASCFLGNISTTRATPSFLFFFNFVFEMESRSAQAVLNFWSNHPSSTSWVAWITGGYNHTWL
jgi:hypothetical protein